MARLTKAVKAVPATAGIKAQGGVMKVLGNVVTVAPEVEAISKDGTKSYKYRPILINGQELGKAFRREQTRPINGRNVTIVRWSTSDKAPIKIWGLTPKDVVTSINRDGGSYQEVPVEGVPAGIQAKAFPSKFDVEQARLSITVYSEYKD